MIIKNIYSKVAIHPLLLFIAVSSIITGLFKDFIILFSIIIFHELGHLMAASHYRYNINKIHLYPFGGYIEFNDKINRSLFEEFIVLISGPLTQIFFFLIVVMCYHLNIFNTYTYNLFINYHYSLLIFNLLPIYPLDGSKLVSILLCKIISFKRAHLMMLGISYIFLICTLLLSKYITLNVNIYLLLALILSKLIMESKNHSNIFNKFLLERYLYNFPFKKVKILINKKLSCMMRDKKHLFVIDDVEITEREMLRRRYNQKNM